MNITVTEEAGYTVLSIEGRIDVSTSVMLEKETEKAIQADTQKLLFDCTEVAYVSSSGLRVFLQTQKLLTKKGGTFVICGMKPEIKDIFKVTGLLQLFKVFENREAALNA